MQRKSSFHIPVTPESTRDPQDLLGSLGCFALETASESVSAAYKEPKQKPRKTHPWDQPRTFTRVTRVNHSSASLPTPPTPSRQLLDIPMDVGYDLDSRLGGCADALLPTRCVIYSISSSSEFLNIFCKALVTIGKQVHRCRTLSFPHSLHAPILLLILPP
jgi:hypothetical protein